MRNTVKRLLAFVLCTVMFASLMGTSAFASNANVDAFFAWYNKAQQDYNNSVIKTPTTWEEYSYNNMLKYIFLVDFNNHKHDALWETAKESLVIDQATYLLLVAEQKLKEQEWLELAAKEQAAKDKAVRDTEQAKADAWAAAQAGVPGDVAYQQFQDESAQVVKDAEKDIADANADYDAANKIIEDDSEAIRKERERRQKELAEEMERLMKAQAIA